MSQVDPAYDADDFSGSGNGGGALESPPGGSTNGALTTIENQTPGVPALAWSYGPPQRPEILSAKANPIELLHAVRRRWPLAIGLGLLVGGLAAGIVAYVVPVRYEVFALLRVAGRTPSVLVKSSEAAEEFAIFKRTQVQLILSGIVLRRTLSEREINKLSIVHEHDDDPASWLKGQLIIDYPDDSEILRVAMKGTKPKELITIINEVVKRYLSEIVQHDREKRLEQENRIRKSYDEHYSGMIKQMDTLRQLEQVAKTSSTESAKVQMKLAVERLEDALSGRSRLRAEKNKVELDIAMVKAREENPEDQTPLDFSIDTEMNLDPTISSWTKRVNEYHEMLAHEIARATKPNESSRVRQIRNLMTQMQEKLDERRAELRPRIIEMQKSKDENRRLSAQLLSLPVLEKKKEELDKQIEEAEKAIAEEADRIESLESYSSDVAGKQEELRAMKMITGELKGELDRIGVEKLAMERITKVDEAALNSADGDFVRKYVGVAFTFLLGFGAVVLGIAFIEFQRRRVNAVGQVNDGLGIRVIGELPSLSGRAWRRIKGGKGGAVLKALMAERIDGTRTALIHTDAIDPPRVVMVTSAEPHEGKTTTASQLAASLARSGRRTVLVDGDIRNPGAHRVFDMPLEPGLCELLRGETERDAAIHPTRTPNLWLLPAGHCELRSVQALSNSYLGSAIAALCVQFDYVIIDSGPVLKVADP
ncbi:MAG TPA: AAA family ATPase, partial [Pirellulales bacterium]|nr:AAA family ATPase [Pirellulales bacterium]